MPVTITYVNETVQDQWQSPKQKLEQAVTIFAKGRKIQEETHDDLMTEIFTGVNQYFFNNSKDE